MRAILTLAFSLWLSTSPLAAQESSAPPAETRDAEARLLFEAGRLAFAEGRFEEAFGHFRRSHELSGRVELFYNIATAADRAGRRVEAIDAYERFLASAEQVDNRPFIESRLTILRRERDELEAARAQREVVPPNDTTVVPAVEVPAVEVVPPEATAAAPVSASEPTVAVILFSVAGLAGVGALVTGVWALDTRSSLDSMCPDGMCPESLRDRGREMSSLALATDVLAGTSLAFAIGGVIAAILTPTTASRERARLTPAGLTLHF